MTRYILILLIAFIAQTMQAQTLNINGTIAIEESSTEGTKVIIFKNNSKLEEQAIGKKGRFDLKLALGADYRLTFAKDGYVQKSVNINAEVPEESIEANPNFPPVKLIINLLPQVDGIDVSIFDQPIAILAYSYELDDFTFEKEYSEKIKDRVAETERNLRKAIAERGAASVEKERLFAEFSGKGERAFTQKQWQDAITSWKQALQIKPENKELPGKITIAQKEFDKEMAEKSIAEQNARAYRLLIQTGDSLFKKQEYANAKNTYQNAIAINKDDAYPGQKISEIETILANLSLKAEQERKQQELVARYQQIIADADAMFNRKEYTPAETRYKEAIALNHENTYPNGKLNEIANLRKEEADKQKALAEQEKRSAEIDAAYQKVVTAADKSFAAKAYEQAIGSYNEALAIKATEIYPKNQIVEAEQAIAQLKLQQEADAERKRQEELKKAELMGEYNKLIAAADIAFKAENYAQAKLSYQAADKLNLGEVYPQNKLKEIDDILNSVKYRNRLADYNKNKTEGDNAMNARNYASAKFYYQKAIAILPIDSETLRDKLIEIEKLIEEERLAAIMKEYNVHIEKADKAYDEKSYAVARFYYKKALEVKKDDSHATTRLEEVDKLVSDRTEKTLEL